MTVFGRPGNHHPNCGCWECLEKQQACGLADRYEPEPPPRGRVIHKIGRITLLVLVYRKQKHYEVLLDGKLIAEARDWPQDALHKARRHMPKKPHKVHGEIIAYRGWGLEGDILTPLSRRDDYVSWEGPVATVAEVDENGTNGLYAAKLEYARELVSSYRPSVHGLVRLSGIVIEHERGYRAQRQVVGVLRVTPQVGDLLIKALEDRYQCQVFRRKRI